MDVKEMIKNIVISILAVVAIILIITIISYNKVSLGRIIPKAEKYELSEEAQKEIESEDIEETEIITTYILDAPELKYYEKTKEYNKGKAHPFADDATDPSETDDNSTNFYKDDGTK